MTVFVISKIIGTGLGVLIFFLIVKPRIEKS